MANVTGDGNYTSKLHQVLSISQAGIVMNIVGITLNIVLSITASLGNVLALIAIRRVSSIHPPTKLIFRCLAVTDLCVGLIVQPIYVVHIIFPLFPITQINMNVMEYVNKAHEISSFILCGVSMLTSTAISVERLLALLLGVRYKHVVTLRRVRVVIICSWLIGASGGAIMIWREDIAFLGSFVVMILSPVTSIFSYTKIHLTLRHHQAQIQNHIHQEQPNGGGIPLNIARYKRTVSSILWVQLALVACYVPFGIVAGLYVNGLGDGMFWLAAVTLLFFNSSLNPILYCWKIREVRQHVKNTIEQLSCF